MLLAAIAALTFVAQEPTWKLSDQNMIRTVWPKLQKANPEAVYKVPTVAVVFLPTKDNKTLDKSITGSDAALKDMERRVEVQAEIAKAMIEEGTRFRGYSDAWAKPSISHQVEAVYLIYGDIPKRVGPDKKPNWPDYGRIVSEISGEKWVNEKGVKEFWVYHWHNDNSQIIETNMASPNSPDVSNSWLENDLPIYKSTYLVYGLNYLREAAMHVHNMGHQMERAFGYANQQQDVNDHLFMREFCGYGVDGKFVGGRVGNCHFPPNAVKDYDYFNTTARESDIESWIPYRNNPKKSVTNATWESLPYRLPGGLTRHHSWVGRDAHWYIYWFQNVPGLNNGIPHPKGSLTNWWRFIADWDNAMKSKLGLWQP